MIKSTPPTWSNLIFASLKKPQSHKGETGIATIVAGAIPYYGAPILCALGAEAAGTDLITLYLPKEHINAAKNYSLNFFLKPFVTNLALGLKDIGLVVEDANKSHALIIGPGLAKDADTKRAIQYILAETKVPCIIDADALFPEILTVRKLANWVITPHKGEFKRLFNADATEDSVQELAQKHNLTIVCKGPIDIISDGTDVFLNSTGCPQMRVGGTGDVLAGIIGGLVSLGIKPFDACKLATYEYGLKGEQLSQKLFNFTSLELVRFFKEKPVISSSVNSL